MMTVASRSCKNEDHQNTQIMLGEKTKQISTFGNETEMVDPVLPVALAIVDGAMRMKKPTTQSPLIYWEKHNGPRFLFLFHCRTCESVRVDGVG